MTLRQAHVFVLFVAAAFKGLTCVRQHTCVEAPSNETVHGWVFQGITREGCMCKSTCGKRSSADSAPWCRTYPYGPRNNGKPCGEFSVGGHWGYCDEPINIGNDPRVHTWQRLGCNCWNLMFPGGQVQHSYFVDLKNYNFARNQNGILKNCDRKACVNWCPKVCCDADRLDTDMWGTRWGLNGFDGCFFQSMLEVGGWPLPTEVVDFLPHTDHTGESNSSLLTEVPFHEALDSEGRKKKVRNDDAECATYKTPEDPHRRGGCSNMKDLTELRCGQEAKAFAVAGWFQMLNTSMAAKAAMREPVNEGPDSAWEGLPRKLFTFPKGYAYDFHNEFPQYNDPNSMSDVERMLTLQL